MDVQNGFFAAHYIVLRLSEITYFAPTRLRYTMLPFQQFLLLSIAFFSIFY